MNIIPSKLFDLELQFIGNLLTIDEIGGDACLVIHREQAGAIAAVLQYFADTGELPEVESDDEE